MQRAPWTASSLAVVALAGVAVGGCGNGGTSSAATPSKVAVDSTVASEVPAAVKKKGTLVVAADATYPPNEFIGSDGHTVVGMDPDLAHELGKVMGLKVKAVNATFDSIIPGLAANKYDLGMSSFTDTKAREKTVDFVTYFSAGTSFYVKAQGGPTINSLRDLCGHTVAVEKGTTQATDATNQSKSCTAGGKSGVKVLVFPDQNGANLAISSGRAQVGMADSPVADYQVHKSGGRFKLVGATYGTAPYGIAIPKSSGMDRPILDALKVLMKKGDYQAIMRHWGLQAGAISNPAINAAVS
jgi:polar amino acid transport system substrate-binding protein